MDEKKKVLLGELESELDSYMEGTIKPRMIASFCFNFLEDEVQAQAKKSLRASLLRTHWVLSHPSVGGMFVMAAVHGATYSGPQWQKQPEVIEAFKLAGLPLDLPEPKYAETEAGVFKKKYQEVTSGTVTFVEHAWEEPNPDDALFLGTYSECHQWAKDNHIEDNVVFNGSMPPDPNSPNEYYVQNTGRVIDNGEEAAFFAQFEE